MPARPDGVPSWTIEGFDGLREIGHGGSATVYAARQLGLERAVAVKVLHVDLAAGAPAFRYLLTVVRCQPVSSAISPIVQPCLWRSFTFT